MAEHGIHLGVKHYCFAALLGNLGKLLGDREDWDAAIRYFRGELDYRKQAVDEPVLHYVISAVNLALMLCGRSDRVASVADEVTDLLGRAVSNLSQAVEDPRMPMSGIIQSALGVLDRLQLVSTHERECVALRSILEQYSAMFPVSDALEPSYVAMRMNQLLRDGNAQRVLQLGEEVLGINHPKLHHFYYHFKRCMAEAFAMQQRWTEVDAILDELRQPIEDNTLSYVDASTVVLNVGLACSLVAAGIIGDTAIAASETLTKTLALARAYESTGGIYRPTDISRILLLRAISLSASGRRAEARSQLQRIDIDDLRNLEVGRPEFWLAIYKVVDERIGLEPS